MMTNSRHRPKAGIGDFLSDRLVYLAIGRSLSSSAKSELVWTGHSRISTGDVDKKSRQRQLPLLALRTPSEPRGLRRIAAPRRAMDDLPQRQIQRRRNRVPVPAAQDRSQE